MKESAIVTKIIYVLKTRGCWVTKLHGGPHQQAGLPDLLVVHQGRAIFLEVKRPGEVATKLQEHMLATLREHGSVAVVVTSADEASAAVFGE